MFSSVAAWRVEPLFESLCIKKSCLYVPSNSSEEEDDEEEDELLLPGILVGFAVVVFG